MSFFAKFFKKKALASMAANLRENDGSLLDRSVIWGEPSKRTPVAVGINLDPLGTDFITDSDLNVRRATMVAVLESLQPPEYLQIIHKVSSDFTGLLENYVKRESDPATDPIGHAHRNNLVERIQGHMEDATLNKVEISLFKGTLIDGSKQDREFFSRLDTTEQGLSDTLGDIAGTITGITQRPMTPDEMFLDAYRVNSAQFPDGADREIITKGNRPDLTIMESTLTGDFGFDDAGRMRIGSKFREVIMIGDLPANDMRFDTLLPTIQTLPHGAMFVVTYMPRQLEREKDAIRGKIQRLKMAIGMARSEKDKNSKSYAENLEKLEDLERELDELEGTGERGVPKFPTDVFACILLTADTPDVLADQARMVRQRLSSAQCKPYTPAHNLAKLQCVMACLPGRHPIGAKEFWLSTTHDYAGDMAPIQGHKLYGEREPSILALTESNCAVGMPLIAGKLPMALLITGMPRSGKSMAVLEMILQLSGEAASIIIIESGGGYRLLTESLGGVSMKITPSKRVCFPYLDTDGGTLDSTIQTDAEGILRAALGTMQGYSESQIDTAIKATLRRTYTAKIESYWGTDETAKDRCQREAYIFRQFRAQPDVAMERERTQFLRFKKEILRTEEYAKRLDALMKSPAAFKEFSEFKRDENNLWEVVQYSCCRLPREKAVRNADIVNILRNLPPDTQNERTRALLQDMADILEKWTVSYGGTKGGLIDGTIWEKHDGKLVRTGFAMENPRMHFDIPKEVDDPDYRRVAVFAFSAMVRRGVYNLPRNKLKILYFDELYNLFANFDGGSEIIKKALAEWQKLNVFIIGATQNLGQIFETKKAGPEMEAEMKARESMLAMFNAHMLFRQESATLVNQYTSIYEWMPPGITQKVLTFGDPSKSSLPPREKFSQCVFVCRYDDKPMCVSVKWPLAPIPFFLGMTNPHQEPWLMEVERSRRGLYDSKEEFVVKEAFRLWEDDQQMKKLF